MSNKFELKAPDGTVVHGVRIGADRWLIIVRYRDATDKMEFEGFKLVELLKKLGQDEHFIRRILESGD